MSPDEKAWQAVRSRIALAARRAGRDPATVGLLAVSKSQPVAAIRAAYVLGQRAFGENYVQGQRSRPGSYPICPASSGTSSDRYKATRRDLPPHCSAGYKASIG